MKEIWKKHNSKYEVSNKGRVRHIEHKRILKYSYPGNGTPQVNVGNHTVCVSHLVAGLFLGQRPIGHDVHHKDENRSNNAASNLEYKPLSEHRGDHHRKFPVQYCLRCGVKVGTHRKYCSAECRKADINQDCFCKVCGSHFTIRKKIIIFRLKDQRYKHGVGIYCSNECKWADPESVFIKQARQPRPEFRIYSDSVIMNLKNIIDSMGSNCSLLALSKELHVSYSVLRAIKSGKLYKDVLAEKSANNNPEDFRPNILERPADMTAIAATR